MNSGETIGANDFSDIFPTNWDEFNLDALNGLDAGVNQLLGNPTVSGEMLSSADMTSIGDPGSPTSTASSMSPTTTSLVGRNKLQQQQGQGSRQNQRDSVTKPRSANGPGRHPKQARPKAQNMFNIFANPASMHATGATAAAPPMMPAAAAASFGYGMSPVMQTATGPTEAFPWMSRTVQGNGMSPTGLMYAPMQNAMGSPQFGFAPPQPTTPFYPIYHHQPQMTMKLPVQALHRAAEPSNQTASNNTGFMAPIVLPTDLGGNRPSSCSQNAEVDPTAITTAITSFLGSGGGPVAGSGENQNMRLYQKTFEAFVQEEAKIDYGNVTVVELKKLLRKYHLAATGKKEELIAMVKQVASFLKKLPEGDESPKEEGQESHEEQQQEVSNAPSAAEKRADSCIEAFLA